MRLPPNAHSSLINLYSSSRDHLRVRNSMISSRPLTNSARLRQRLSIEYPRHVRCGSRVFQASSAPRTLATADSCVKGGTLGLLVDICNSCCSFKDLRP